MMINFMNDYNSPCHPAILKAVADAVQDKYPGYATDDVSERARRKIVALLGESVGGGAGGGKGDGAGEGIGNGDGAVVREDIGKGVGVGARVGSGADVHFLVGGTQVNLTVIGAFLRPHEAVIAAGSSHIQLHETGAIEAGGHRILLTSGRGATPGASRHPLRPEGGALLSGCGKLSAGEVREICLLHDNEHMVKPRLVYISQSTELGGVYSLDELRELRAVCDDFGLLLYIDGARLGAALTAFASVLTNVATTAAADAAAATTAAAATSSMCTTATSTLAPTPAPAANATLADIAALCDAFYIGGTKNGLMFGEALVIMNDALKKEFRYIQKQRGGMLAKGFLLGIQFNALFEDGLYFRLAEHANQKACILRAGLENLGIRFYVDSPTNQIFPIFRSLDAAKLAELFLFETWEQLSDEYTAVRFVTSWNTTDAEIDALLTAIANLS